MNSHLRRPLVEPMSEIQARAFRTDPDEPSALTAVRDGLVIPPDPEPDPAPPE